MSWGSPLVLESSTTEEIQICYVATGPMANLNVTERLLHDYDAHQRRNGYSFWAVVD